MSWSKVVDSPLLRELPFKIELDTFGKLLMARLPIIVAAARCALAISFSSKSTRAVH